MAGPTATRVAANGSGSGPHPADLPAPASRLPAPPASRHRPAVWLAGIALIAAGGGIAAAVVTAAGQRVAVVAVVRDVPVGTVITADDLGQARVAADPALHPVPASASQGLVGQYAAVDLRAGTLLTASEVTSTPTPGAGQSLVGVSLHPGQLPARPLAPGDRVALVVTPGTGASAGTDTTAAVGSSDRVAVVSETGTVAQDGSVVVDLLLPADQAASVAVDASAGHLSLVLLPRAG